MPDYNPAVALGIQPPQAPQSNPFGMLGTVANIQAEQARTNLYTLQALQQQRQYNGLMAAAEAFRTGKDPVAAAAPYGLDPTMLNSFQALQQSQTFAARHGNLNPQGAEAESNMALRGAETANARAEFSGKLATSASQVRAGAAQLANQYAADPTPENWRAMRNYTAQFQGEDVAKQLDAITDPQARMARATGHIGGGLTASEATAPVEYEGPQGQKGVTTRLGLISGPSLQGQTTQQKETAKTFAAENTKDIKEANDKFNAAGDVQQGLLNIRNNLGTVGGGFLTPGTNGAKRVAIAKAINTSLQSTTGQTIFDPQKVAAAEATIKGTTNLGFNLARTLGSREAQMIVQQSIGVQPGIEQTPEGNRRIMATLLVAAQRDKDHAAFTRQYIKDNPNSAPGDADLAFSQGHPVSQYVADVGRLEALEQQRDKNGKSPIDRLVANPSDLAKDFNNHFFGGENMARYFGAPQ